MSSSPSRSGSGAVRRSCSTIRTSASGSRYKEGQIGFVGWTNPIFVQVVGVSAETGEAIRARVRSLEELDVKTECKLRRVLLIARHLPAGLRQEVTQI